MIPYGGVYAFGDWNLSLVAADPDWGLLYIFAIGSIATYGSVLAGWASNNNWSLLGGLRVSAQMISYEVTMGLSVVGVFMVFGTLKLTDMAIAQDQTFRLLGFLEVLFGLPVPAWLDWIRLPAWGVFYQPLGFVMFLTAIMAENKRPPFDMPEGESEIIAGYHLEYSGMRFGLFYMSEFIEIVVIAGLVATIFLGGWAVPFLSQETIISTISGAFNRDFATAAVHDRPLRDVHAQGARDDLGPDGAALDAAALPVRPGHGSVLEDHPSALDREHLRDRGGDVAGAGVGVSAPVVLFYIFAALAVASALGMVLNVRNTVASAMSLVVTMIALAGIYLLLGAYLVAVVQIMVYAGAIVVLFLFVVMLLNLRSDNFSPGRQWLVKAGALLLTLVVLSELLRLFSGAMPVPPPEPTGFGGYRQVGIALYTDYVLLVEMSSLLLLAAIVGALILSKRRID